MTMGYGPASLTMAVSGRSKNPVVVQPTSVDVSTVLQHIPGSQRHIPGYTRHIAAYTRISKAYTRIYQAYTSIYQGLKGIGSNASEGMVLQPE